VPSPSAYGPEHDEDEEFNPGNQKPPGEQEEGTDEGSGPDGEEGGPRRRRRRRGGRRHRRRRERERLESGQPGDAIPTGENGQPLPHDSDEPRSFAGDHDEQDQDDEHEELHATPLARESQPEPAPVAQPEPVTLDKRPSEAPEEAETPAKTSKPAAKKKRAPRKAASKTTSTTASTRRAPKRTPPKKAAAPVVEAPVVKTGSADKHLASDDPIEPQPVTRPRSYSDLDDIPDDYD